MFNNYFSKFLNWVSVERKKLLKRGFKYILPVLYVKIVLFGFILAGLYTIFPTLIHCGKFFGAGYCSPIGLLVTMFASTPGYIIGGSVLRFFPKFPVIVTMVIAFSVALIFYRFLGLLIDKVSKGFNSKGEKIKFFIFVSFFVLIFLVLTLI